MEEKYRKKDLRHTENSNMAHIDLTLSVVTLNVNGLKCTMSPPEVTQNVANLVFITI